MCVFLPLLFCRVVCGGPRRRVVLFGSERGVAVICVLDWLLDLFCRNAGGVNYTIFICLSCSNSLELVVVETKTHKHTR